MISSDGLSSLGKFKDMLQHWGMEILGLYYGPYRATVTSNKDPDGGGAVEVACPRARMVKGNGRWFLPAMAGAHDGYGEFWPPEEGSTVFVFFDNGNPEIPQCYIGGWYAEKKQVATELQPENNASPVKRGWATKGGHKIVLDDTDKSKKITIKTPAGSSIILDDSDNNETITIEHKNGKVLQITSGGKVKAGNKNGQFEPMMRGTTVKNWLESHTHPHSWGSTGPPTQPFPPLGLSNDTETS